MSLYVVTGTANAGKTGLIHGAVRDAVGAHRTASLLLPSVPDVRRAQRELAATCALGLSVQSLDAFLDSLWLGLADGRAIVATAQRLPLINKAISLTHLKQLEESAKSAGFVRSIGSLITRACESDVLRAGFTQRGGPAGELLTIIANYVSLLEDEGLVERVESHNIVSQRLGELVLPEVIAANRFGNLTPPQERFLRAAARKSDVWVALTWDPDHPATSSVDTLVRRLAGEGRLLRAQGDPATDTPPELVVLEERLFASDPGGVTGVAPEGAVVRSEAWGAQSEVSRIACEVQEALSEGVRPNDIAVVFRSPEMHADRLRAAFRDAGIMAEYDLYLPLAGTGIVAALRQLLRFFWGDADRRDLLGFLHTAYTQCDEGALDDLDARLRQDRVSERRELVTRAARIDLSVGALLKRAERLCRNPVNMDTLPEWWDLLAEMMTNAYGVVPRLGDGGGLDARAMSSVMTALTEMSEATSLRFTVADVLTYIQDARISVYSEESESHVQVLSAERMRGRRFSRVIIGGLTADEFPLIPTDDALTATGVARDLASVGIDVNPRVDLNAERLLFYQVATRARHKLVLSRRVSNDEGLPVRPSPLLEELLDLYRDPTLGEDGWYKGALPKRVMTLADLAMGTESPQTTRRELRQELSSSGSTGLSEADPRLAHARWRGRRRAVCLDDDIAAQLATRSVFSASEIETYLVCPYMWYVQRVLRPESLDVEFDAGAIGLAAHNLMKRFYEVFTENTGERRVSPATLSEALEVHDRVAAEVLAGVHVVGVSEEIATRRIARATRRLVGEDATTFEGFTPAHHEWCFGFDDDLEDFGSFFLRGRIDRIDIGDAGLIVTDYKSGSVQGKQVAKFVEQGLVQLPLYVEVARRRLDAGGAVAALYRSILNAEKPRGFYLDGAIGAAGLVRNDALTEAGITSVIDDAIARASAAVEGIKAGRIERKADAKECPTYCPARVYCEAAR